MSAFIKTIIIILNLLAVFPLIGNAAEKMKVFVSIVPQKAFVQQIGKDYVVVQSMVQPGASPATYEPKPRQMAELSKTQVYFAIGVPFEKIWLGKIAAANANMQVIHTDHGMVKRAMATHHPHENGHEHDKEAHHKKGDHAEEGSDPHIWLSPPLVKIQARTILEALQAADPVHRDEYKANFDQFINRIDQLDNDLKEVFVDKKGLRFMVFHPSWGYFADAYGLEQVPIEIEGKAPKPAQLQTLIQQARKSGIKMIFVQPQFSTKSAQLVAREIGGQVVFADPLAENWLSNMRMVADRFKAALK